MWLYARTPTQIAAGQHLVAVTMTVEHACKKTTIIPSNSRLKEPFLKNNASNIYSKIKRK